MVKHKQKHMRMPRRDLNCKLFITIVSSTLHSSQLQIQDDIAQKILFGRVQPDVMRKFALVFMNNLCGCRSQLAKHQRTKNSNQSRTIVWAIVS